MAPRFYASPFKNAVAQTGKKDAWWSELNVSTSAASDSADLIKTCSEYFVAQGTSGSLVCHGYDSPGKLNHRAPTLQAAARAITDFDVSRFDDLIAAGSDDGKIVIHELPPLSSFAESASLAPNTLLSLSHPSGRAIDTLSFHPTSSSLLLASSQATVAVYDIQSHASAPAFVFEQSSPIWSAKWSGDGRLISTTGKDGLLRLWDVRQDSTKAAMEIKSHGGLKCSRHVWLGGSASEQIFTTGFSKMREREFSLVDTRAGAVVKNQRLDNNMGVLIPVVDQQRNIVYLAGRGDMTLHWVEVGGPATFTQGGSSVPTAISSIALTPPAQLNLMKAEINRVMLLTNEAVLPIPIEVPRRQYIDFHQDLYPPVPVREPAQDAQAWMQGGNILPDLVAQDPSKKVSTPIRRAPITTPVAEPAPAPAPASTPAPAPASRPSPTIAAPPTPSSPAPSSAPAAEPTPSSASVPPSSAQAPAPTSTSTPVKSSRPTFGSAKPIADQASTPASLPTAALGSLSLADEKSTPSPAAAATPAPAAPTTSAPTTASVPASAAFPSPSAAPYNPGWSRNFLAGKTPLKPEFYDVHGLSATMSADVQILKANRQFLFFPLSGPGGRLAVHPVASAGRLPTHIPSIVCGATIVDFELSPFAPREVFIASDDSKIRCFELPEEGIESDVGEAKWVLGDAKMDKIGELRHHPTAKSLLLSVSEDRGSPTLRLWDVAKGELLSSVPLPSGSISSSAWSPDGSLLALSTKTKQIHLLDPRRPSTLISTASHDSPRPVRLTWASPSHIISTGFNRAASRELILYTATRDKLEPTAKQSMDISPAPLFPFVDLDTNVLLLYSKGDRTCLAYEVHPEAPQGKQFLKLPSYEHGSLQLGWSFLPKKGNDVKSVEILDSFRLSESEIRRVKWSVPRARTEFFQDDVFVPTRDVERYTVTTDEWLSGKDAEHNLVDLRPEGMTLLSQAPATAAKVSTRSKISGPVVTESQKQEAYMARLFAAAKAEGDEEEEPVRSNHAPDDDDW